MMIEVKHDAEFFHVVNHSLSLFHFAGTARSRLYVYPPPSCLQGSRPFPPAAHPDTSTWCLADW